MQKRHIVGLSLIILIILMAVWPTMAQARSVFWTRWDVVIDNIDTTNNRFDVAEIYDVQFTGTFRFGSAVIPLDRVEEIRDVQVFEAGQPLTASCNQQPGTYCVQNTSEGKSIVYYFNRAITDASQSFRIDYTVVGALRVYDGGDQLWWAAIPSDHFGFSIGSSTVTVQLPPGFGPREGVDPVLTYGAPGDVSVNGTTVVATATRQIRGNESFEIRVQYPHDANARTPFWQSEFDSQRDFAENMLPLIQIGTFILSLVIALGGVLGMFIIWRTQGRDPEIGPVPDFLAEPPSDLPPAIVGTLVDEKADLRDILSTIIDLARRGYVVIEENREKAFLGFGMNSEFTFKRTDKSTDDLRAYERKILSRVFTGGVLEQTLDALKNKFYRYIPDLQTDLYTELVNEGLFRTSPASTRAAWTGTGMVIAFLSVILFIFFAATDSLENVTVLLLCIPASLGVVGVFTMIVGQFMPRKTEKGAQEAAKWGAFLDYLYQLETYVDVENVTDQFDKYLPYAVAFGMDRSWVRKFSRIETVPMPYWYYPRYYGGPWSRGYTAGTPLSQGLPSHGDLLPGELASAGGGLSLDNVSGGIAGSLESISSGLTDMLNSAGRVLTSRPQSTAGTGSGSWSSGGRSWSGGGFRGGGFSGGGSRGFG